jgi:RNA polymerase sigma-70 factor (ECF subfamily)
MTAERQLAALYDDHAQALFAFVLNLTRDEADTRDVLQEIFLKLARKPSLLDNAESPRAFLLRMAHNLAIDQIRRRATRQANYDRLAAETVELFEASPDDPAFRDQLTVALAELPEDQRAVVHLKLWEEMTFEQIAMTLDIPPNTAASRYRYGIDKLRDRLRPIYEEMKQ